MQERSKWSGTGESEKAEIYNKSQNGRNYDRMYTKNALMGKDPGECRKKRKSPENQKNQSFYCAKCLRRDRVCDL